MAIITPDLIKSLQTAYNIAFQQGLTETPSTFQEVATVIQSSSASNTYGWLGQFPRLQEWIGSRQLKNMKVYGYQIVNKLYESSIAVPRTEIEDDNIQIYAPLFKQMGYVAATHPDEMVYSLLGKGHLTNGYDNQCFFDTEHPVYSEADGTGNAKLVTNLFTPQNGELESPHAWYLLDTTKPLKPIIYQERLKPNFTYMTKEDDENVFMRDEFRYGIRARNNVGFGFWQLAARSTLELNEDNFNKVYDAMRSQSVDGGRPLDVRPSLLVIPTQLRTAARKVVGVERLANGQDNINYNLVKIHESVWLNSVA